MKTKTKNWLLCIGGVASIGTILTWLGLTPFSKTDSGNTEQHVTRDNATSYGQSGGITANSIVVNQYPTKPTRQLTKLIEEALLKRLEPCLGGKVTVSVVLNDKEALAFAEQVAAFLSRSGYQIEGVEKVVYAEPPDPQAATCDENKVAKVVIGSR